MNKNELEIVTLIGKDKFKEEMDVLKKMEEQDKNKGEF